MSHRRGRRRRVQCHAGGGATSANLLEGAVQVGAGFGVDDQQPTAGLHEAGGQSLGAALVARGTRRIHAVDLPAALAKATFPDGAGGL